MVGFIFPGQGSQSSGMGSEMAENFSVAREVFEEADDTLQFSLSRLCFEGPEEKLKLTEFTQPAILAVSTAVLRVVETETGLQPKLLAGHSLGEYSALVAAGVFSFADALLAVRHRGLFMQEAVPQGTGSMAAVLGLENDVVDEVCREAAQAQVLAPANYNSPGQIVIAGHTEAVNRAIDLAKEKGCRKAVLLPVSAPFHCTLMDPAGVRLEKFLAGVNIHPFKTPVVTNVEGRANNDHGKVPELLVRQVSSPVLWEDSVREMTRAGINSFIEIGPGKVLAGLIKRIDKKVQTTSVDSIKGLKSVQ